MKTAAQQQADQKVPTTFAPRPFRAGWTELDHERALVDRIVRFGGEATRVA